MYTATINFTMPHPKGFVFNYHWESSMAIHERWKLGKPGTTVDASETIFVNSGNTLLQESTPSVHVECR